MLKRQRSIPSFVPVPDPYPTADPAIDMFEERVAKRRRQFAPPHIQSVDKGKAPWRGGESDGEEDVEKDEQAGRLASSEQAQRIEQAGEYKNVNTLLHDLHAEQRHRLLFSTSSLPAHMPFAHEHAPAGPEPDHPFSPLHKSAATPPAHGPHAAFPHGPQRHMPAFTISIPTKDASVVDHVEVQRVTREYENTNRCASSALFCDILCLTVTAGRLLGALFLERRRQCSDQDSCN